MKLTRRGLLLGLPAALAAAETGRPPVLVELFTSEGCSSCPPADNLLRKLAGGQVIALSEHVDYWNQLGWKDPYSNAIFSQRQEWYAQQFGGLGPYTPQMVVDGVREFVGSNAGAAERAIAEASRNPKAAVDLSWNGKVSIRIEADSRFREPSDVMLAITESNLASNVKRGENSGRLLRHTSVVRSWTRIGEWDGRRSFALSHDAAIEPGWNPAELSAVVFAQRQRDHRVVAVGMARGT